MAGQDGGSRLRPRNPWFYVPGALSAFLIAFANPLFPDDYGGPIRLMIAIATGVLVGIVLTWLLGAVLLRRADGSD